MQIVFTSLACNTPQCYSTQICQHHQNEHFLQANCPNPGKAGVKFLSSSPFPPFSQQALRSLKELWGRAVRDGVAQQSPAVACHAMESTTVHTGGLGIKVKREGRGSRKLCQGIQRALQQRCATTLPVRATGPKCSQSTGTSCADTSATSCQPLLVCC